MHRVRQQDLPFQGSSHQFVGAEQGDVNVSVFLLMRSPAEVRDPIVIPMTKYSSYGRGAVSGWSTARSSKPVQATFSWSRPARSTASAALEMCRWFRLMCTSVPVSFRKTSAKL